MTSISVQELLKLAAEQHQAGLYPQAEDLYRHVLDLSPNHPQALHLFGILAQQSGQLALSEELIRKAITINPAASMYCNLGVTLLKLGEPDDAIVSFKSCLGLKHDHALAYLNLGNIYKDKDDLAAALDCFNKAITHSPDLYEAHFNLANLLKSLGELEAAISHYKHAIESHPAFAEGYFNLGICYQEQGLPEQSVKEFTHAIRLRPSYIDAHSSLIFTMDMHPGLNTAEVQQERSRWAAAHTTALDRNIHKNCHVDPEKKLRIGYVSADFRKHSAACVFGMMLRNYEKTNFEVYAYSNSSEEDDFTSMIRQEVTMFRNIHRLEDAEVAKVILDDAIDILVDLSGHSRGNRLLVFARKPAPIQVTAWGHIGGTGMKEMDYFLADPIVVPQEEKSYYAEKVLYLPCAAGYYPLDEFPEVNPLPALSSQSITFGSFNRLAKVTQRSLEVWAQVLKSIPESRIIIKATELDQQCERDRLLQTLVRMNISEDRIELLGKTTWIQHIETFNRVDISLDPFPHGGGVTTLESIMMGVPVVTLRWPTLIGRLSASIMTMIDEPDFIADSPEEYVRIAVGKAGDLNRLSKLRQHLRPTLQSSFAGNAKEFTSVIEQTYRTLWRDWCVS